MKTHLKQGMKSLSTGLSFLMFSQLAVIAARGQSLPAQLNIVVVEGEGAINNIRQPVSKEPIVRVEDESHKPIAGVAVMFTLPTEGATGEFGNGSKSLLITTDNQGQAAARGLKANAVDGKVPIHVNASYRGLTARTNITQFNVVPPGAKAGTAKSGGHGKLIAILVVVGAAAAGGAVAALHSGNSNSGSGVVTPPAAAAIGITAGTGTIVAPGH